MFNAVGNDTQAERLRFRYCLLLRISVGEYPRYFEYFCDPALVVFEFSLYREFHMPLRLLADSILPPLPAS